MRLRRTDVTSDDIRIAPVSFRQNGMREGRSDVGNPVHPHRFCAAAGAGHGGLGVHVRCYGHVRRKGYAPSMDGEIGSPRWRSSFWFRCRLPWVTCFRITK